MSRSAKLRDRLTAIAQGKQRLALSYGLSALLCLALAASLLLSAPAHAAPSGDQRCFAETGYCIAGRIRSFWEQNGGLPVFGFPTGPQHEQQVEGHVLQVQQFERNRLELHAENRAPYDVLLGRLGDTVLSSDGRSWNDFPRVDHASEGCRYFPETGHSLCEPFLSYWHSNGLEFDGRAGKSEAESLALFGVPLSEPHVEVLSDGEPHIVQWFERARFERHEQNPVTHELMPEEQQVLLGLLGNEEREHGAEPTRQPGDGDARGPEATATPEVERDRPEPTAEPEADEPSNPEPTRAPHNEEPRRPTATPRPHNEEPHPTATPRPHNEEPRPTATPQPGPGDHK
jgi:hypothetical protein